MTKSYAAKLTEAIQKKKSPILLGMDPRLENIPPDCFPDKKSGAEATEEALVNFASRLFDALSDHVAAVKPQIAFYEQHGLPGLRAYQKTIELAQKKGLLVIADIKRGDIGSTASAYAEAHLEVEAPFAADAVTLHPWLGEDSLEPFFALTKNASKGIYLLLHTSNPGSKDLQEQKLANGLLLYQHLGQLMKDWQKKWSRVDEEYSSIGAVVGATFPEQLKEISEALPETPLLIPGYGAQGGSGRDVGFLFSKNLGPHLVNASRSLIFAWKKFDTTLEEGAIRAAEEMKKDILG